MRPDQNARLAETLPWLVEPVDEVPSTYPRPRAGRVETPHVEVATTPVRRSRGGGGIAARVRAGLARGADEPPTRRRRAVAVLGVAGILAGGYAVTASEPASTVRAVPAQPVPGPESETEWVARAQVTLTSVNRQLDTIAQTEDAWNRLPEERRATVPAEPVQALKERKALLERRKATLQSQIDTYRSLDRTKDDLKLTEQHLDAVEKALQDPPAEPQRSPEQASVIAALDEQRDLRLRQRDAKREELESLEKGVESALRAPLPDDGQATAEVSNEVLDVIRTGGRGDDDERKRGAAPRRPDVLAREERQQRERQDTPTGGPPDPRGPGDETAKRSGDPDRRADGADRDRQSGDNRLGPVVGLGGTVADLVTGGGARTRDNGGARGGAAAARRRPSRRRHQRRPERRPRSCRCRIGARSRRRGPVRCGVGCLRCGGRGRGCRRRCAGWFRGGRR
ncbi:hypothetical protein ACQPWY_04890 [Pseudonocardia xinjiangensis]|uniref:hypothetical protein n=1 Tax=Pseudonocardia xinjiangensis TaxID=75289 RepID=UPI003D92C09C